MSCERITVSLVTYRHTVEELRPLLESLATERYDAFYVVDNSSSRSFENELKSYGCRDLHYMASENRGFGAGHNQAIRKALETGSDFHVIINPDIYFEAGTFDKIISFMASSPEIGLVMPRTVAADGSLHRDCKLIPSPADLAAKRFLCGCLKRRRMRRFTMLDFDYGKILDVPYLCGCFMVFSRKALETAGLFDERFFMYPEDIDITRRIYASGFRTVYYPDVNVVHAHTQASYKSWKMLVIHIVNMIRYFNKWGWIFDPERKKINREILKLNSTRRVKCK